VNAKSHTGRHLEEKESELFVSDIPVFSPVAQNYHEESPTKQGMWSQDLEPLISRIRNS
jgi:hypothetical protein